MVKIIIEYFLIVILLDCFHCQDIDENSGEDSVDPHCVDLSLDCEEREHLCKNGAFHDIMLERCPRTCNLCHELLNNKNSNEEKVISSSSKEDYEIPPPVSIEIDWQPQSTTTFLPPSPPKLSQTIDSMASLLSLTKLVGSAERYLPDLETVDAIFSNSITRKNFKNLQCRDFASDCQTKLGLCDNIFYSRIMERFCRSTCGFCGSSAILKKPTSYKKRKNVVATRLNRKIKNRVRATSSTSTSTSSCIDLGIDCNEKRSLCTHRSYTTLMTKMCSKTCNFCTTTKK